MIKKMTKKDRIAIVLTIPFLILFLLLLIMLIRGEPYVLEAILTVLAPVVVYWGYRFIKGDISFMK